jgi:hypothetical protein
MNTASIFRPALLACAAAGLASGKTASAQEFNQPQDSGYYFRLGAAARFGVKASITGNRPVLPTGVYDNGYVLPDAGSDPGGPISGKTWNWGYNSPSQIQGNDLSFSRYDNVPAMGRKDVDVSSPLLGGEIIGGVNMLEFTIFDHTANLAIELGYNFSSFSTRLNTATTGTSTYTVRTFGYNGVVLPQAPYAGTPQGPGPLIDFNPSGQNVFTSTATTIFGGSLESSFHELRLGPSLNVALNGRLTLGFGAGYSSVFANSTLRYDESATFSDPSTPAFSRHGDINKARWSPGVYAELRAAYQINRQLSAYLGGDIASHKDVTFGDNTYQVKLNLGSTYGLKLGLGYSF